MVSNSAAGWVAFTIILIASSGTTNGAKILVFLGLSSHSHRVAIQPLATKLSERGHEVTFLSPIKPEVPNPNIKEFCPQVLRAINEQMAEDTTSAAAVKRIEDRHFDPFFEGNFAWDLMIQVQMATVKSPEFSEWLNNSHFDLIIYDHPGKEYVYPMALQMKAKVIAFVPTASVMPADVELFGLPIELFLESFQSNPYWYIPDTFFSIGNCFSWYFSYMDYYLPKAEAINREVFDFDFPPLEQLIKNVDLILINDHVSTGNSIAYPPMVVPVGGMHVKESNGTLPKDMEDFLADVDQFVYISFGSIIRVSKLPLKMRKVLFEAVESIPRTKFLWKWEGDIPEDLPKNALAKNWFPQQDVLAHPKCKGFVTQGGLMSLQQSIFHGVPVLVVPGFGDQPFNAQLMVKKGFGMYLELADITVKTFSDSIRQLIENTKYSSNVKKASRKFKDRPMSAVDTAVWWTEYVLRHDTTHLKSDTIELNWWQRRYLHFWATLFAFALVLGILSTLVILKAIQLLRGRFSEKKLKQQ